MSWVQTGVTVGVSLHGVWSGQQAGKEAAKQAKKRGSMIAELSAFKVRQRTLESKQAKLNVLEQGAQAQQTAYLQSSQDIANTVSESSGSGAIISGSIKDVQRMKENQGDAIQVAITQNTNKNIEAITRDTDAQNAADKYAAQQGQTLANEEAHSIHRANQRQFVAGILNTAVQGYSAYSNRTKASSGKYEDKAFWTKDFASWEQIKSGQFHI
tara:strand:+ start:1794 stop:2432 length:639 start_codon:yes stop_codon:yes gene_type:complete